MLIVQKRAENLYDFLMEGYVSSGYKTEKLEDGTVRTLFTFCYDILYNKSTREKTYYNATVTAYEEDNAQMIAGVKREKRGRMIVLGNTDRDPDDYRKSGMLPRMRATSIFPITEYIKMRDYMRGSMKYDSQITKAYQTRYDYETPDNESDHML